jgi:hypothetical protein
VRGDGVVGGCAGDGVFSPLTVLSGGFPDNQDSSRGNSNQGQRGLLEYRNRWLSKEYQATVFLSIFLLTFFSVIFVFLLTKMQPPGGYVQPKKLLHTLRA